MILLRTLGTLAIVGAIIAFVMTLTFVLDTGTPNSTQGVSVVGDHLARVPQGETIVFTRMVGKSSQTWKITHHGSQVATSCSGMCSDPAPAVLCGVGCKTIIDTAWWDDFRVQLRDDGAVNVDWPDGWTYRPYRS